MRVLTFNEAADLGGISRRHLERLVAEGSGPATVRLSPGRIGILECDWTVWLLANRTPSACQVSAESFVRGLIAAFHGLNDREVVDAPLEIARAA